MLEAIKEMLGIDNSGYEDEEENFEVHYPQFDEVDKSAYSNSVEEQEAPSSVSNSRKSPVERKMNNKVVGIGLANSNSEVVVIEPLSFEEMPQVIQALRERKSVVLNLNMMNPEQAQRAVDFVAGGTFAMDGHQERVGESIFLFTPSCVKVSSLTGVIHDVQQPEARVRRPMSAPEAWGEPSAVAQ